MVDGSAQRRCTRSRLRDVVSPRFPAALSRNIITAACSAVYQPAFALLRSAHHLFCLRFPHRIFPAWAERRHLALFWHSVCGMRSASSRTCVVASAWRGRFAHLPLFFLYQLALRHRAPISTICAACGRERRASCSLSGRLVAARLRTSLDRVVARRRARFSPNSVTSRTHHQKISREQQHRKIALILSSLIKRQM